MPPTTRKSYHHGDLRRQLIDAALALLAETGSADFTLRSLARRIGVSHAAPYAHFADREAVLAEIARLGFGMLATAMRKAAARHTADPSARLVAIGVAYVCFGYRHPAHYRLMFGPELVSGSAAYQVLADTMAAFPGAGATGALAAWSLVHGLTLLTIDRKAQLGALSERSVRALAEAASRLLVGGLGSTKAADTADDR
jgi:AcrR family transcriptional regulator